METTQAAKQYLIHTLHSFRASQWRSWVAAPQSLNSISGLDPTSAAVVPGPRWAPQQSSRAAHWAAQCNRWDAQVVFGLPISKIYTPEPAPSHTSIAEPRYYLRSPYTKMRSPMHSPSQPLRNPTHPKLDPTSAARRRGLYPPRRPEIELLPCSFTTNRHQASMIFTTAQVLQEFKRGLSQIW